MFGTNHPLATAYRGFVGRWDSVAQAQINRHFLAAELQGFMPLVQKRVQFETQHLVNQVSVMPLGRLPDLPQYSTIIRDVEMRSWHMFQACSSPYLDVTWCHPPGRRHASHNRMKEEPLQGWGHHHQLAGGKSRLLRPSPTRHLMQRSWHASARVACDFESLSPMRRSKSRWLTVTEGSYAWHPASLGLATATAVANLPSATHHHRGRTHHCLPRGHRRMSGD